MVATTAPRRRPLTAGRIARDIGFTLAVVIALAPAAFVFFWMVTSSFKQQVDIYTIPPKWLDFAARDKRLWRACDGER